ncbi:MAG: glycosyltransferase family 4 protein [Myxococcales bacterium]|nr:glycosyltransferase family 4 protein [Myxococcales bacterium]
MTDTILMDARYLKPRQSGIGRHVGALLQRLPALAPEIEWRAWIAADNRRLLPSHPNLRPVINDYEPNGLGALMPQPMLFDFGSAGLFHSPHNTLGPGVKLPSIVTVHDIMWLTDRMYCDPRPLVGRARQWFFRTGIERAIQNAEHILTVSKASADVLVGYDKHLANRITVTPNAADASFSLPSDVHASRSQVDQLVGKDTTYYLVVGQNQASKGHAIAVRAFAAAHSTHKLVLLQRRRPGDGLVKLVQELGIEDRVQWLSEVDEMALVCLLQNAHALLQPSLAEGFGMPALEAMSCGCPVIASDIPPLVEVLGGAGMHVRAGDASALAKAIEKMNDPSLRAELSEKSVRSAKRFSWQQTAETALTIYRQVLG